MFKQSGVILSLCILLSSVSYAKGHWGKRHGPRDMQQVFSQLNLSSEQEEKIKDLHDQNRKKNEDAREALQEARQAFKQAIDSANISDDELKKHHEKMIEAKVNVMRLRFDGMISTRAILTAEQRRKFQEIMTSQRGRKHRMKKNKGNFRKGPRSDKGPMNGSGSDAMMYDGGEE